MLGCKVIDMVETGEAFFTKYGSMHRTLVEAEKAEEIEREDAFAKRVMKLSEAGKSDRTACGIRDAAFYIYNYPKPFLQAMDEFGFFDTGKTEES